MTLFVTMRKQLTTRLVAVRWAKRDAVVDGQGRVHGMNGLRVVDASIMPLIITGNLNATTIMIAEKIADQIRGHEALSRSTAPFYVAS